MKQYNLSGAYLLKQPTQKLRTRDVFKDIGITSNDTEEKAVYIHVVLFIINEF